MKKTAYLCIAASIVLGACASDKDFVEKDGVIYAKGYIYFSVNNYVGNLPAVGGSGYIDVSNDTYNDWEVSGKASWLTLSADRGKGSEEITVTAGENMEVNSRENVLNFAMSDFPTVGLNTTVYQDGAGRFIRIDSGDVDIVDNTITLPAAGGTYAFPITSNLRNVEFTARKTYSSSSWLQFDCKVENGYLYITTTDRTSRASGFNYVQVRAYYDGNTYESAQITVIQQAYSASADATTIAFTNSAQSRTVTFDTNVNWEVENNSTWVRVTPTSGGYTDKSFSVSVDENLSSTSRTSYIYVNVAGTSTSVLTFTIVQDGANVSGTIKEFTDVAPRGDQVTFSFTSAVPWQADAPSWVDVAPAAGVAGKTDITITVLPNYSSTKRSDKVRINNIQGGNLWTIDVRQNGASFVAKPDEVTFTDEGGSKQIHFTADLSWELFKPEGADWFSVSPASSPGISSGYITITAEENTSTSARTATFKLGYNSTLATTVTVTQSGKDLIDDSSVLMGWEAASRQVQINATGDWSTAVSDSWMSVAPDHGSGPGEITLTVTENTDSATRTGSILLVAGGRTETIAVAQIGQYLTLSNTEGTLPMGGGTNTLTVSTTLGADAKVEYVGESTDWLTVTSELSRAEETINYAFTAEANPNNYTRQANIVIEPAEGYKDKGAQGIVYKLYQEGRQLSVSVANIVLSTAGGMSESVSVYADGEYAATKAAEDTWYTLVNGTGAFSVVATPNNTGTERRGSITISLTGLPSGQETKVVIPVVQVSSDIEIDLDEYGPDKVW